MSNTAYLFPGQGAQYIGMARDFYEGSKDIEGIFKRADEILEFSLSKLMFEGPQEELTRTDNCQPAILLASIAALMSLKNSSNNNIPKFAAGLSLGEYTALVASGALSFEDAVFLVRRRAELMQKAALKSSGSMVSIIGLPLGIVEDLCKQDGVEVANINSAEQIVVSGAVKNLEIIKRHAEEKGAKKAIFLEVGGAFHSSFMKEAAGDFKAVLSNTKIQDAQIPVVSNFDAKPHVRQDEIRENLEKQLYSPVLWLDSISFMISQGVDNFIEIGPGKVLRGLMRRIDPTKSVINIEGKDDVR